MSSLTNSTSLTRFNTLPRYPNRKQSKLTLEDRESNTSTSFGNINEQQISINIIPSILISSSMDHSNLQVIHKQDSNEINKRDDSDEEG